MIYCNYDTQNVVTITLDDLQVGDEIILTIRSSEIEMCIRDRDVDCPLCDDHKGKMNLNFQKNVFRCNRCGESGGCLLYTSRCV